MLYYSLVYPYLTYCNIVWGTANNSLLNKLFMLQKRAIRLCAGVSYRTSTAPLFVHYQKLKLVDINKLQIILFMYKRKYNLLPWCCMNYATICDSVRNHETRSVQYFKQPRYKTCIRKKSVVISGPILWNSLPVNIQRCSSFSSLKKNVIQFFTNSYLI